MNKKTPRGGKSIADDDERAIALREARLEDSFAYLGVRPDGAGAIMRAFIPDAEQVEVCEIGGVQRRWRLAPKGDFGLYVHHISEPPPIDYRLMISDAHGVREMDDPYRFGEVLSAADIHAWRAGRLWRAHDRLGGYQTEINGITGCAFVVWAPRARRVAVVGDFNGWDNRVHGMRKRHEAGIWEIFLPGAKVGDRYKFDMLGARGERLALKADPFARAAELRPETASIVAGRLSHRWADQSWMAERSKRQDVSAPISVYEMHLGSWRRADDGGFLNYREIGEELAPYLLELGFTHVQFLPVTEHPYDPSWGYQPTGLFAPTSRFGTPEDFAALVDRLHQAGLGVLCDYVPAHFPTDGFGLAQFDGAALFEDANPKRGFHPDWNTLIYDWGRPQVLNFLVSSALCWLDRFHIDGLRVDAVSSMLYLDYSRKEGEWEPNAYGGNINLEAVSFLQKLNEMTYGEYPGISMVAEESTAWPGVCRATHEGGLGFGYKWNMGWMHDTLKYMARDPIHRRWHHDEMTFGISYAWSENFVLALSHDEVVHGKGSLLGKMPGPEQDQFANLRAYYAFMWAHPGKKLLFMGGEFAQRSEWNHDAALEWGLLADPRHSGVSALIASLNRLYRETTALHECDCDPGGFEWVQANAREDSVFAFLRWDRARSRPVLAVFNFTPVVRAGYLVGVPIAGSWRSVLNTADAMFGGEGFDPCDFKAQRKALDNQPCSLSVDLPALSGLLLVPGEHL